MFVEQKTTNCDSANLVPVNAEQHAAVNDSAMDNNFQKEYSPDSILDCSERATTPTSVLGELIIM